MKTAAWSVGTDCTSTKEDINGVQVQEKLAKKSFTEETAPRGELVDEMSPVGNTVSSVIEWWISEIKNRAAMENEKSLKL